MESLVQLYMLLAIFCLLLFQSFREIFSNHYLKILLVLLFFFSGIKMLTEAGWLAPHPLIYLSGNAAVFLFIPAVYLYLRNQVYQKRISGQDWQHLMPAAAYCVIFIVLTLLSSAVDPAQLDILSENSTTHKPLLYFIMFGYGVTGWYLILLLKILKDKYSLQKKNEYVPATSLYSTKEQAPISSRGVEVTNGSIYLSDEKVSKLDIIIKEYLDEHKPFLKHGYSLKQLAEETRIPLHLLSAFINKHYKVNFNDFINEYRVNYCKVKILNDEWKYKKLEAIAEESGFSNRNTFTAAFKRVTGINPSEFLKVIKDQQAA
jgi:AraC-like DNA-binding protein